MMVEEPWEATEPNPTTGAGTPTPAAGIPVPATGKLEPSTGQPLPLQPEDAKPAKPVKTARQTTRAGVIWTFTIVAIIVAILLVIFMIQNQVQTTVTFLGFQGQLALGIAMLIAAIGGAAVVAIAGAVRIVQLRSRASAADKRLNR